MSEEAVGGKFNSFLYSSPKFKLENFTKKKGLFLHSPEGVCSEKRNGETLQSWKERQAYMNTVTAANNLLLTSQRNLNIYIQSA